MPSLPVDVAIAEATTMQVDSHRNIVPLMRRKYQCHKQL